MGCSIPGCGASDHNRRTHDRHVPPQGEALIDQPGTGEPVAPSGADRAREALREALVRGDTVSSPRQSGKTAAMDEARKILDPAAAVSDADLANAAGWATDVVRVELATVLPEGTHVMSDGMTVTYPQPSSVVPDEEDQPTSAVPLTDFGGGVLVAEGETWSSRNQVVSDDADAGQSPVQAATSGPQEPITADDIRAIPHVDHECEPAPENIWFCRHCGADLDHPGAKLFDAIASSVVPDEEDSPTNCRSCGEALDDGQSFLCGACALAESWTPDQDRPVPDPAVLKAVSRIADEMVTPHGPGCTLAEPCDECRRYVADIDQPIADDIPIFDPDCGCGPDEWCSVCQAAADGLSVVYLDTTYPTPPWRTVLGPDEPIRITLPGVYELTAEEYHSIDVTGDWFSNSDGKALLASCPAQFDYDRRNKVRKISDAFDWGHVWHALVLGKGEKYQVFEPKKKDGRTKEGQAQKREVDAARAAGITPIYGDQFRLIEAMAEAVKADPVAYDLMSAPGRQEVCLFWREQIKVTDPHNSLFGQVVTVQRRAMIDHLPDMPAEGETVTLVDGKTADDVKPDDNMRKKIYDYAYHRQADTYAAGVEALFNVVAEVVFLFQSKKPPHLIVPVDLDTPAMRVAAAENRQALEQWAECVATGKWPGYAKGVETSGVPAWIERRYEDEIGEF